VKETILAITGSPVKDLIRSAMKLSVAVALPLILFLVAYSLPDAQPLLLGLKAASIQYFGTPAEYRALVEDTARESAARRGILEAYMAGDKVGNALRAMHELDACDPQLAKNMLDNFGRQCECGSENDTGLAPRRRGCNCAEEGVE